MLDETALTQLVRIPGALGVLVLLAWASFVLIRIISTRFASEIREHREDIARLRMEKLDLIREHDEAERRCDQRIDRLEADLAVLRDKARADRQQCDEQIARLTEQVTGLRRELARYTPPGGTPVTG